MRKFIVSDLHGNGEVYDSIMAYLDNIALKDEVELFINGDLIDRGQDNLRMILDVREREHSDGSVKVHYLGGNHEHMMYRALMKRKPGKNISIFSDWYQNGGWALDGEAELLDNGEEILDSLRDYVGELPIYHVFQERVLEKPVLLVHAHAPKNITMPCPLKIKDHSREVFQAVWMRKERFDDAIFIPKIIGYNKLGRNDYFTIIGHTPVLNKVGFTLQEKDDLYLNIDGGCAAYAKGHFQYDHVPLVEVRDGYLSILVFNHNNEIINGYYYDGEFHRMNQSDLDNNRVFLNPELNGNGEKNKELIKSLYQS